MHSEEFKRFSSFLRIIEMFEAIDKQINEYTSIPRMYGEYLLYYREIHAIRYIGDHEGTAATDMAKEFGLTKSTISHLLTKLKKRGFISQTANVKDAKIQNLFLTDSGKAVYTAHREYDERRHNELYEQFDDCGVEEFEACIKVMGKLIDIQEKDVQKELESLADLRTKGYI